MSAASDALRRGDEQLALIRLREARAVLATCTRAAKPAASAIAGVAPSRRAS